MTQAAYLRYRIGNAAASARSDAAIRAEGRFIRERFRPTAACPDDMRQWDCAHALPCCCFNFHSARAEDKLIPFAPPA